MTDEPEYTVYQGEPETEFADAVVAAIEALFDASAVHQDEKAKLLDGLKKAADSVADKHSVPETVPEKPGKPEGMELEDKPKSKASSKDKD